MLPGTALCVVVVACLNQPIGAQTLEERLNSEAPASLAAQARREGDPIRGARVFYSRLLACSSCHSVGDRLETIGPDLTKVDPKSSDAMLVESLLQPSKQIASGYATVTVHTVDGQQLTGVPVEDTDEQLVLRSASQPDKLITVAKQEIEDRRETSESIMPTGQVNQLGERRHFLDLVRYLIDLREGGAERARQLQPPPDPVAEQLPDSPLPWRPVVQRGEVEVESNVKYPRAVALGFVGGTAIFDADQLSIVSVWQDGFVKPSPQNYFGLFWHRDGTPANALADGPNPLHFRLPHQDGWQSFEPPTTSDPNVGTRFDGYQIGESAVRLHYRVLAGQFRIGVTEDVRVESRPAWQGVIREFRLTGLPSGGQAALALPAASAGGQFCTASGDVVSADAAQDSGVLLKFLSDGAVCVAQGRAADKATWQPEHESAAGPWRLVSRKANAGEPIRLRVEVWRFTGSGAEPTASELSSLANHPRMIDDSFDRPRQPPRPLPPVVEPELAPPTPASRPAVQARENVDEFTPVRGRFIRFVVTRTNDDSEPGIDELEVYGPNSDANLALTGKAHASSVIRGFPIHQIAHLNDGELGNQHSWISSEPGGGWAEIEFPEPVEMNRIVWARDRIGDCADRLAIGYRIEVSDDRQNWRTVGDESGRAAWGGPPVALRRDASPGYVMEAVPGPFPTWRPSDIAFGDDGSMYAIAMTEGQVWRSRIPPQGRPELVKWHRYATGLYHPIGLAIVDGRVYVAQKPEITELIDRDGDGTAEYFRTVATGWGLSTGWHEYCFGLAVDRQANLWFALNTGYFWTNPGYVNPGRWRGGILRVTHETERLDVIATGCRVPNGIALGPDGNIFFTDNQGDWIQSCKLTNVVPGRFYGHPETTQDALEQGTYPNGRSAIWFPYDRCRSVSGPAYDATEGRFGPFSDQLFVGDVGYGANPGVMRVALENVKGQYQGACFRFIDGQPFGCERMRFGPDGQLYLASLTSGLTRMSFDGQTPLSIHSVRIRPAGQGFVVHLTRPLDADTQLSTTQFRVKRYHYLYTGNYGSPQADETIVSVQQVDLSADLTTITLTFPVETYPIGMVYEINLGKLTSAEGDELIHNEAWYTVQEIPDATDSQ